MVSSGLIDQPHVSHFRLTIHLLIALSLLALALWLGLDRVYGHGGATRPRWSGLGLAALAIIVVQIAYGGLVAGLKAGHVSNTWPLIERRARAIRPVLTDRLMAGKHAGSAADRPLHPPVAGVRGAGDRTVALLPPGRVGKTGGAGQIRKGAAALVVIVLVQIGLGISVVVFGVPIGLALLHQTTALLMFATAIYLNHRLAWARGSENGR